MLTLAPVVESVVAEVAPVHGVSIGTPQDKSTWRISFKSEATDQQRAAAAAVLASFDVAAEIARQALPRIAVSRLRFKLELAERGLLPAVNGTIAALPGASGDTARLYWTEATEFESDHALVLSIGGMLDPPLSPSEIRVMFEAARDRAA